MYFRFLVIGLLNIVERNKSRDAVLTQLFEEKKQYFCVDLQ